MSLARDRFRWTVPGAMPSRSAIARSDMSSQNAKYTTERCATVSLATARRTSPNSSVGDVDDGRTAARSRRHRRSRLRRNEAAWLATAAQR